MRGFTGRDVIVKFGGNYHGHVDSLLVAAGSSAATLGVPNSPGVTAGTAKDTLVLQYNDVSGLEAAFQSHGSQIAGVIVEPVVGNMGVVMPTSGFLHALRELTEKHGAVLIFDEVMTGFRVAYGGAQSLFGIRPDLTTLGKIVGGGLPVGDVWWPQGHHGPTAACRKSVSSWNAEWESTGDGGGGDDVENLARYESVSAAGAIVSTFGERFRSGGERSRRAAQRGAGWQYDDAVFWRRRGNRLAVGQPLRYETIREIFLGLDRARHLHAVQPIRALFVSAAHSEADIDATIAAAREALQ